MTGQALKDAHWTIYLKELPTVVIFIEIKSRGSRQGLGRDTACHFGKMTSSGDGQCDSFVALCVCTKSTKLPGEVVYTYQPRTRKAEAGESP